MRIAPLPPDEPERLRELRSYGILDTEPEAAFDAMVHLASYICQTPIAAISLVDEDRQWFKAITGLDAKETPRDVAFCAHAILQDDPLVVPDARCDPRFADNPLVTAAPDIRFYAGVPLVSPAGHRLGTLCVIDSKPRELSAADLDAVRTLASNVMAHLELRQSHRKIRQYVDDLQLAASIFDSASEGMLVTDADNRILTVNPAFTALTGYALSEVVGRNPKLLASGRQDAAFYKRMWTRLQQAGHWSGEVWNRRKNGDIYAEWLSVNVIFNADGTTRLHLAIFSDITKKKMADEVVWEQANFDHLTGLPNRRLFLDRLEQNLRSARRGGTALALLFIDLDHFKEVNDAWGHEVGDALLKQAAQRIAGALRDTDTVARLGGDEFTVILPLVGDTLDMRRTAEATLASLRRPFDLDGHAVSVGASIGVAMFPQDSQDARELLRMADAAMYAAKRQGRGQCCFHAEIQGLGGS